MPRRVMLLAGAPPPSALDENNCTLEVFDDSFRFFVDADLAGASSEQGSAGSTPTTIAPWRSIQLHPKPLHTGFSQANSFLGRPHLHDSLLSRDFLCTSSLASSRHESSSKHQRDDDDEAVLNEFCEQSLALHNSLPWSQPDDQDNTTTTAFLDETSFQSNSTTTTNATGGGAAPALPPPPNIPPAHLSDLDDVPSAEHVVALQPQTITLNVIVGVLAVAQPRSVRTRWGQTLSLVEILVGDDTRSGFAVTFWLAAAGDTARAAAAAAAAGVLGGLRRQDVVLLQNVALHVFRGKVYGQSLRRGQTSVHLLWSRRQDARACYRTRSLMADGGQDGLQDPQLAKTRLVRDWVIRFVGIDPASKGRREQHVWDRPPDDTQ